MRKNMDKDKRLNLTVIQLYSFLKLLISSNLNIK